MSQTLRNAQTLHKTKIAFTDSHDRHLGVQATTNLQLVLVSLACVTEENQMYYSNGGLQLVPPRLALGPRKQIPS